MNMIKYSISQIKISNFRGIKELTLEFKPDKPSILIGPNNAGKSSFLDAFGMAMCSAKFLRGNLEPDDFWIDPNGDQAQEFTIDVLFNANNGNALPAVKGGIGDPVEVHGIRCKGDRESLTFDRKLLNANNEEILLLKSTPVSKANKDKFKGMGLGGRFYARSQEIQEWMPEVWQLDPKNLFVSLYEWKSGPLQQLLKLYKERLFSEAWKIDDKHQMPAVLDNIYGFLRKALKTPFWEKELSPKLNSKMHDYLGKEVGVSILPDLNEIDAWILSQFSIRVSPANEMAPVDIRRLGDGWQSLMRLASLEVLLELNKIPKKILLLVEEPETYLHPHLRRKMRRLFNSLQAAGHQIVCATHSQELISFAENQQIIRVTMNKSGVQHKEYLTDDTSQGIKDEEKLGERGNHEMVFAQKVILTEGKGDQFAVRLGLEKQCIDMDAEGISVIDCGSVNNIPGYAKICASLGIPWFAVHDNDIQDGGQRKANTNNAREQIDALIGTNDRVNIWDNDLESIIGFKVEQPDRKVTPTWIANKWGNSNWQKLQESLNSYTSVLMEIRNWIAPCMKPDVRTIVKSSTDE